MAAKKSESTSNASAQGAVTPAPEAPETPQKFDETIKGGLIYKGNPANPIAVNAHGKPIKQKDPVGAESVEDEDILKTEGLTDETEDEDGDEDSADDPTQDQQ